MRSHLLFLIVLWLLTGCGENHFWAKREPNYFEQERIESAIHRCLSDTQLAYFGPPRAFYHRYSVLDSVFQSPDSVLLSQHNLPFLFSSSYEGEESYQFIFSPTFEYPLIVSFERVGDHFQMKSILRAGLDLHYKQKNGVLLFERLDGVTGIIRASNVVIDSNSRYLSSREIDSLQLYINEAYYWDCPFHCYAKVSGACNGHSLILYGYKSGLRNYRAEYAPQPNEFTRLCAYMLRLSGFETHYRIHLIR